MDQNLGFAPLDRNWAATGGIKKRSAYLWHPGLWMACKESRDIATKNWYNKQGWADINESTKYMDLRDAIKITSSTDLDHRSGVVHRKSDYEPWYRIVGPWDDIFCITADTWKPLVRGWKPVSLEVEDGYGCKIMTPLWNIAVEFDPSWNLVLPKWGRNQYDHIEKYPASLSFLIWILMD
ncbi:hypothetical protein F53441_6511 [Fusarium austroafricanum]|uniref:Uncharacterized protein n=1 Tax=Fusarium austroafricanum TaxID=2364996 RepID=A0A8H4KHA2_9HYPO|nr:hypothetical protein F53441_6511 [Fusarium austroafricanum]